MRRGPRDPEQRVEVRTSEIGVDHGAAAPRPGNGGRQTRGDDGLADAPLAAAHGPDARSTHEALGRRRTPTLQWARTRSRIRSAGRSAPLSVPAAGRHRPPARHVRASLQISCERGTASVTPLTPARGRTCAVGSAASAYDACLRGPPGPEARHASTHSHSGPGPLVPPAPCTRLLPVDGAPELGLPGRRHLHQPPLRAQPGRGPRPRLQPRRARRGLHELLVRRCSPRSSCASASIRSSGTKALSARLRGGDAAPRRLGSSGSGRASGGRRPAARSRSCCCCRARPSPTGRCASFETLLFTRAPPRARSAARCARRATGRATRLGGSLRAPRADAAGRRLPVRRLRGRGAAGRRAGARAALAHARRHAAEPAPRRRCVWARTSRGAGSTTASSCRTRSTPR